MSSRKNRVTISKDMLETILRLQKLGRSAKEIAEATNLSLPTIFKRLHKAHYDLPNNIVKLGRKSVSKEHELAILSGIVQDDNSLNLNGIKEKLEAKQIVKSTSTICLWLKKEGITRKRLKRITIESNSPRVMEARFNFARKISEIADSRLVYLDETGINLHTNKHFGYSPKNIDATIPVKGNRGCNISTIAVITCHSIVAFKSIVGSFTTEKMLGFLTESLPKITSVIPNPILIMDNASIHHSQAVAEIIGKHNMELMFLPAYSPDLNPIENYFSSLKSEYNNINPRPANKEEIINSIEEVITRLNGRLDYAAFFTNMRKYVQMAYNRMPFH